jgi:misacylated tRNA(Ala) deacylase
MVNALYMNDSYLKEWNTKVISVKNDKFVELEQTAFFPKGGGVENDTGIIIRKSDNKEFKVLFVGKFDGKISHQCDEGLQPDDEVTCKLDWTRRYLLMRYHTAAHVLSGVFNKEYGLMMTGNQLTVDAGRIDMNMDEMDLDLVKEGFDKANELIQKDLPVKVYYKSMDEAKKDESLFKLAIGFPHDVKELRIVDIIGYDAQADGGCHVNSLKEIGEIKFIKAKNKGKNNRRIYFELE